MNQSRLLPCHKTFHRRHDAAIAQTFWGRDLSRHIGRRKFPPNFYDSLRVPSRSQITIFFFSQRLSFLTEAPNMKATDSVQMAFNFHQRPSECPKNWEISCRKHL